MLGPGDSTANGTSDLSSDTSSQLHPKGSGDDDDKKNNPPLHEYKIPSYGINMPNNMPTLDSKDGIKVAELPDPATANVESTWG